MSGERPDEREGRRAQSNRASVAALIAVLTIAALGYWAFTAIERQRVIARCLDEGRRDCLELAAPER